jgi:uncharacterized integral membrane protein (TIGR00698 family)
MLFPVPPPKIERIICSMQKRLNIAFAILALALVAWGSPPLALVAGMIFALFFGAPFPSHGPRLSKTLLQVCVVLLGFSMNLPVVLRAGLNGSLFAVATIGTTLLLGFWLGGRLALNSKTSALISAGTAICGGSAIAAVGSVIAVTEAEIAVAIGTVFLLNAAALYLFPLAGHALHLSQTEFGLWAGVAIHDISSVVGAAMSYGSGSLETATAVKLSRTLWIAPLTLGMGLWFRRHQAAASEGKAKSKFAVPWFIGFFLLASLVRSCAPAMEYWTPWISQTAREGMTLVLCLIGSSISARALRMLGWRTVALGVALWLFISIGSLLAIRLLKLTS